MEDLPVPGKPTSTLPVIKIGLDKITLTFIFSHYCIAGVYIYPLDPYPALSQWEFVVLKSFSKFLQHPNRVPPTVASVAHSSRLLDSVPVTTLVRLSLRIIFPFSELFLLTTLEDRDRGYVREELPLPTQPPFTAHIGNLSFDATQTDISNLFVDCEVTNVRIVEDKMSRAPKGFGYVEFASVEGLKKALTYQGASLQGRNIRVSVAEPRKFPAPTVSPIFVYFYLSDSTLAKERQDTRDFSDWSRKGPLPDIPQRRVPDRQGFGTKAQDNVSDAGSDRASRRPYEPADGKNRDFSNWERRGPLSPTLAAPPVGREGGRPKSKDGPQFRRPSPAWGEGRSQDGSRPPRREFNERPPPPPSAAELDNQWRARMRPDPPKTVVPPPEAAPAPVPAPAAAPAPAPAPAPAVRPKLQLQKRTVPESETASPAGGDSKASPFGGAKPIDSAAREREVEEKRVLALRQKKEAEDKAKAEKAEQEKIAKEQAKQAAQQTKAAEQSASANGSKEGDSEYPQGAKNFEILSKVGEGDGLETESEAQATETPTPREEKTEAPKEAPRQPPAPKANGNWRNGNPRTRGSSGSNHGVPRGPAQGHGKSQHRAPAPAPAAEPEEEGWNTVSSSRQRSNRRGRY